MQDAYELEYKSELKRVSNETKNETEKRYEDVLKELEQNFKADKLAEQFRIYGLL